AEALEPVALLAQRRDVAAEVRALAVQRQDVHAGIGGRLGAAAHQGLGGGDVDEEDPGLAERVRLPLGPGWLRAADARGGSQRELAAEAAPHVLAEEAHGRRGYH